MDALLVENYNDYPYLPAEVGYTTVSWMSIIAYVVRQATSLPLGVNVLFNDFAAELIIAEAVGARFIRAEVFVESVVSDSGVMQAAAPYLQRLRQSRDLGRIAILADIQGKNTYGLVGRDIADLAEDAFHRGLADAVIVTGAGTGKSTSLDTVAAVKKALSGPVLVGSGVNLDTLAATLAVADGAIIGSHFKEDGRTENRIDEVRVRAFMSQARLLRQVGVAL